MGTRRVSSVQGFAVAAGGDRRVSSVQGFAVAAGGDRRLSSLQGFVVLAMGTPAAGEATVDLEELHCPQAAVEVLDGEGATIYSFSPKAGVFGGDIYRAT